MRRFHVLIGALTVLTALGACASRPMSVRLNNEQWRTMTAEHFHRGMTEAEVHSELDALGMSRDYRMNYDATPQRGRVLLARSYVGGGAFVNRGDSRLEFNDLSFEFDASGGLAHVYGLQDAVRYFNGGPAYGPQRATMKPVGRFPGTVPPPVDPLEKATELPIGDAH